MQLTDDLVRTVVQEVLAGLRSGAAPKANGQPRPTGQTGAWGVFDARLARQKQPELLQ